MSGNQWKRTEKAHAERYGAYLNRRMGPYHGTNYPDWVSDIVAGESKHSENVPLWIIQAVQQSVDNERRWMGVDGKSRIPIVVLHQNTALFDTDVVMIRDTFFRGLILPGLVALGEVARLPWKEGQK